MLNEGSVGIGTAIPLAFGCASLGGRYDRQSSLRALACAADHGITIFDTARSYGYGDSEAILGEFLRGRGNAVVSTKAGIRVRHSGRLLRVAKAVARRVFSFAPGLRVTMRRSLGSQHESQRFAPAEIVQSVEESLTALRRERVEFLFLHDANLETLLNPDIAETLNTLRESGKVLHVGVSAAPQVIDQARGTKAFLGSAVQFKGGLRAAGSWNSSVLGTLTTLKNEGVMRFANQPFDGGSAALPLGSNATELLVRGPLVRGYCDVVVTSMMKPEHIMKNVAAFTRPAMSEDEIKDRFKDLTA